MSAVIVSLGPSVTDHRQAIKAEVTRFSVLVGPETSIAESILSRVIPEIMTGFPDIFGVGFCNLEESNIVQIML
jgi:hypothetical protein